MEFKRAQQELDLSYEKEQSEFIQKKIDEIQCAVINRKSVIYCYIYSYSLENSKQRK